MNRQTQDFLGRSAILGSSQIGFEFEFFCRLGAKRAAKSLSEFLGKKVVTAYKEGPKGKKIKGAHTEVPVSYDSYKIEHDFSGGFNMLELVTGPTPFFEAKVILAKVLNWIKANGRTNDRSGLHINISFDKFKTPDTHIDMTALDPLKLILSFDEDRIFNEFPKRKDNVFASSIDFVLPINMFTFNENIKNVNRSSFITPNEKYFGFNFLKVPQGYIEMRYIGGKDYEDRIESILEVMDYTVLCLYDCLQKPSYTDSDAMKLRERLVNHKKFVNGISSHRVFRTMNPKIAIMVDLKQDDQVLMTYWNEMRSVIFDLTYINGMKSGMVNLDTDMHRYQIKDAVFEKPWKLSSYDIVDTKIKGSIIENCVLIACKIRDSQLFYCDMHTDNSVLDSKIKSCGIKNLHNKFVNCYIDNAPHNVKGTVERCIIRSGGLSQMSTVDDKTKLISV